MCLSSRMNMLLSLSLWFALMMSSCCDSTSGNTGSHEEESASKYYEYWTPTPTPTPTADYDYNATFEYYYNITFDDYDVNGSYHEVRDEAAGIGPLSPVLLLGLAAHQIWN